MLFQILVFSLLAITNNVLGKSTRIIGGDSTRMADFPFMAAIVKIDNRQTECAGAIVSSKDIITAAHCLYKYENPERQLKILVGNTNLINRAARSLHFEQVFLHPQFVPHESETITYHENDIAIIKTQEYIRFTRFITKVNLPTEPPQVGDFGTVAGWGLTSFEPITTTTVLKQAWMRIYDSEYCTDGFPLPVQPDQFCAFQRKGVGPCLGDSGAPLISNYAVIGVASTCVPCAQGVPDIYTDVFKHINFITGIIEPI